MPHIWDERRSFGQVDRPALLRHKLCFTLWGLLLVALPGCIGPRSLELTRLRYDQAVHETTEQQWLRNIVRLRYGDLPSFMDVSAITSQFELSSQGSITGGQTAGLGQQVALREHVAPVPRRPDAELYAPRPDRADPCHGRPGGHHGPGVDGQQRLEPRRRAPS